MIYTLELRVYCFKVMSYELGVGVWGLGFIVLEFQQKFFQF